MNALFISDLHLSEERPHTVAAFFAFLAGAARDCDSLYILGDCFDAWIGDDDDRPLVAEVAATLAVLSHSGVKIFFQHGNRDFLLGEDYARRCGMMLLPAFQVVDVAGERCLLAHGDQFCTGDAPYQQFRAMVRETSWQAAFLARPLAERRDIAAELRTRSRDANSLKAEDIMDVAQDAVLQAMQEHGATILLHGHTHRPARHAVQLAGGQAGERVVLGEWDSHFWVVSAGPSGLALTEYPAVQPTS